MALIKSIKGIFQKTSTQLPRIVLVGALLLWGTVQNSVLFGQNAPGGTVLLAMELQDLEKKAADPSLSGAARHEVLLRFARLLTLSGNIEQAVQAWTDAAFAEEGNRDDTALLEAALCAITLGEWDQADANITMVIRTGQNHRNTLRARYLSAQIGAFRSGNTQDLLSILVDPDYIPLRSSIYYTLWKTTGAEAYKTYLIKEYPASPEARIAQSGDTGSVSAASSALWFLFPGRESLILEAAVPAVPSQAASASAQVILQTGLFSKEENARAMATRLRNAGFTSQMAERVVNGATYWAVWVSPGPDMNGMILRLKDAGFESFPVF